MEEQGCTSSDKVLRRSDFSIARILGTDQVESSRDVDIILDDDQEQQQRFEWLQCTRYRPPRLPRTRRREGTQRRKLGRNPRIPFSSSQVGILEQRFRRGHYLSSADVAELASFLALSETRVKIWFQNRRARERRDCEARQRSSPGSEVDISSAHDLRTAGADESRTLPATSAALANLSRVHGLHQLAVSRARVLAGSSAFAPVCTPLALLAAARRNLTATAQSGIPDG